MTTPVPLHKSLLGAPHPAGLAAIAGRGKRRSKRGTQRSAPELEVRPTKYFAGDIISRKYRLEYVLGEGGMGSVWLARNLALDAEVAIKLIRREIANAEASTRLLQEARAAARLGHPNIVRIFDFGETDYHEPFIVMELLPGESLGDLLDRELRMTCAETLQVMLPVASALITAHAKDIVHRDLKPENIVLVNDETGAYRPKVVDFGIAKLLSEGKSQDGGETVVGSPDYMSPEQARGRLDVDQRADVWAFAVVLYEMIAGRRPFQGATYHELLTSIVRDAPPSLLAYGRTDRELWGIIQKGLAKDRNMRWPTMRALGCALARWAVSRGIEHDVGGQSIALHWLDAKGRSLSPLRMRAVRPTEPPSTFELGPPMRKRAHRSGSRPSSRNFGLADGELEAADTQLDAQAPMPAASRLEIPTEIAPHRNKSPLQVLVPLTAPSKEELEQRAPTSAAHRSGETADAEPVRPSDISSTVRPLLKVDLREEPRAREASPAVAPSALVVSRSRSERPARRAAVGGIVILAVTAAVVGAVALLSHDEQQVPPAPASVVEPAPNDVRGATAVDVADVGDVPAETAPTATAKAPSENVADEAVDDVAIGKVATPSGVATAPEPSSPPSWGGPVVVDPPQGGRDITEPGGMPIPETPNF